MNRLFSFLVAVAVCHTISDASAWANSFPLDPGIGSALAGQIAVAGNGQPIPNGSTSFSSANHTDFGELSNMTSLERTFTISNSGASTLSISSAQLNDAGGHFSITTQPAGTVAAGGSTTMTVSFDGSSVGVGFAKITINSDDPSNGTFTFYVRGVSLVCWSCGGITYSDASACSGNGTCTGAETCECDARYSGNTCGTYMEFEGGLSSVAAAGSVFFSVARTFKGPALDPSQVYTWKIFVDSYSPLPGKVSAISIGISTDDSAMTGAILGESAGWSYDSVAGEKILANVRSEYGPEFGLSDVITVVFDGPAQTLSYFKNGVAVGQAFTNVKRARGNDHLYPAVSMNCQHCAVSFQ